jgi:GNAT superfamily N-acetyltransferase
MNNISQDISIIEKQADISFDEIYRIVYQAHEENRKNGIQANTKITNGDELAEHIGKDAVCYVAMDGDRIVGTVSVDIRSGIRLFTKGKKIARLMHLAVLQEYAGNKLGSRLIEKVEQYAIENDADAVDLFAVERNPARQLYIRRGYEPINYIYQARLKQYSVYMVKWIKACQYPRWLRRIYYTMKRCYIRIKNKGNF